MWDVQVELVLIYLEQVKDFEQQLPADTQAELAKGAEGGLKNYPIYETGGEVRLDANLVVRWCVLKDFLRNS